MIRFLLRLIGFLILAGGFVALVIDGTRSIASGGISLTSAQTSWSAASPETLDKARAFVANSLPAGEAGLSALLAQPTFAVLGIVGILLMLLGRRRRRPIGAAS
ncbi:hypothetical protein [Hansschlegelia plantiphila]|uniref:Uncharacterized protein n=1 Tax=Hansschlegelia plantiphila TaxID=374655 RepID=A0A9W6IYQ5_9HYPH|nr:hypothetical protein [Hansschlegelia plantiphila]GLK67132.1 hypothetical protein GCM10008179_07700 [Hansschlegelia plantiphila]